MKKRNPCEFKLKQFTIIQEQGSMKVGTDSLLIGAWAPVEETGRALDIGTGTGIIALMLAQRAPGLQVDALELEPRAAEEAGRNGTRSPWKERIRVITGDFRTFTSREKYDLIVSNPPFFPGTRGTASPIPGRALGRQDRDLPPGVLLTRGSALLREGGKISLILPSDREKEFLLLAEEAGLFCSRLTEVSPLPGRPPHRLLVTLGKKKPVFPPVREQLVIEEEHHRYTEEIKKLTGAFYLSI